MSASEECSLLGTFGWWLQLLLAFLSFSSLVYKKYTDTVPRTWTVWFMDTSKQGFAAGLVHLLNMGLAKLVTALDEEEAGDACLWYFVSVVLDDSLGVLLIFILLQSLFFVYRSLLERPELTLSGEYGDPPSWVLWRRQLADFLLVVICSKAILLALFLAMLKDPLGAVAAWLLSPLDQHPKWKLATVMVITPLACNCLAYWVTDNFLMSSSRKAPPRPSPSGSQEHLSPEALHHSDLEDAETAATERAVAAGNIVDFNTWQAAVLGRPASHSWRRLDQL